MIKQIQQILQTNNIETYKPVRESINGSFLFHISSYEILENTLSILQKNLPSNYKIRNVLSTLQILIEPNIPQTIPIPFSIWKNYKQFVNLETTKKSSYSKLPPIQKQQILKSYENHPFIDKPVIYKLSEIKQIAKLITKEKALYYFQSFPNLQLSLEHRIIPYQMAHKFEPEELLTHFINLFF